MQIHTLNEQIIAFQNAPCNKKATDGQNTDEIIRRDEMVLTEAQSKQSVILKQVKKLEDDVASFQRQLALKDQQLSKAKTTIQELRTQGNTQEEVMALREEVNRLLQAQVGYMTT